MQRSMRLVEYALYKDGSAEGVVSHRRLKKDGCKTV
jgi:hypothetical protein